MIKIQWPLGVWRIFSGLAVKWDVVKFLSVMRSSVVLCLLPGLMGKAPAGTIWKSCLGAAAEMEKPASGVHVPACMHTNGCMMGSCRTEHVCELKVVIFSQRPETSLSTFLDVETECKANVSYLNVTVLKRNTVLFHFVPIPDVTSFNFFCKTELVHFLFPLGKC